jgi:hypothetical protein
MRKGSETKRRKRRGKKGKKERKIVIVRNYNGTDTREVSRSERL